MRDIDSKVVKTLEDDEMVVELMTVGEKMDLLYYNGKKEGINKKSVEAVDAFVSRYNIPLEEACETIGITIEEYNSIKESSK